MGYGGGPVARNPLVENGLRLTLSDLTRGKPLRPHSRSAGRLTWTSRGQELASVSYEVTTGDRSGVVRLVYEATPYGGDPVSMDYTIGLVTTEQPGGALRFWFWCDRGRAMATTLYRLQGLTVFACRRSFTRPLSYRSQRVSDCDRHLEAAQRIRLQLGGSPAVFDAFPERPRGMHRSRYERMRAKAEAAGGACLAMLEQQLERTGYRDRVFRGRVRR